MITWNDCSFDMKYVLCEWKNRSMLKSRRLCWCKWCYNVWWAVLKSSPFVRVHSGLIHQPNRHFSPIKTLTLISLRKGDMIPQLMLFVLKNKILNQHHSLYIKLLLLYSVCEKWGGLGGLYPPDLPMRPPESLKSNIWGGYTILSKIKYIAYIFYCY